VFFPEKWRNDASDLDDELW